MAEDTRRRCKCHDEPMVKNSRQVNGEQKWACARKRRMYGRRRYWERGDKEKLSARHRERVARGMCSRCKGPLTTDTLCWSCLSELEERRALYL